MNILADKTFRLALLIIRLSDELKIVREFTFANQILRSATSIGANLEEALGGQSKKDFLSKIYIAYKEARETNYWLKLLRASDKITPEQFIEADTLLTEIRKILNATIRTTKQKMKL